MRRRIELTILAAAASFMTSCGEDPYVPMTEANVPKYSSREECIKKYGEVNCRQHSSGYFHPHFIPGQTYWNPNRGSYYRSSPTSTYTPRSASYGSSYSGGGSKTSITTSRGGFSSGGASS
jgi:uncharacterized membrane protein YgcG